MKADEICKLMAPIIAAAVIKELQAVLREPVDPFGRALYIRVEEGFCDVSIWKGNHLPQGAFQAIRREFQTRILLEAELRHA